MRFEDFVSEDTNIKKQWQQYVKSSPMIKSGIEILDIITKSGYKAYVVGGAVRDVVLGLEPHDIDISTNMPMDELEKKFKTYDVGQSRDFGIVVVNRNGFQFEICQFREDGEYLDGRRPESVQICTDFKGDASRRDFCFNAMGIDKDGNILDYFDGVKAIRNKTLSTVGDPSKRFGEDYLRMLRAVRFSGKLGFDIDPETSNAIRDNKEKLSDLSPERIRDELMKMASQSGDKFSKSLVIMDDLGILEIILPEVSKLKGSKENIEHHPEAYDSGGTGTVFDHVMAALKVNKLADPIVNLSILFHDIGKSSTYAVKDGKHTYYGHASEAKDIIDVIAKRLKLTNKDKKAIIFAAVNHMKIHNGSEMKPSKVVKLVTDENWPVLKAVSYADDAARMGLFDKKTYDKVIDSMEKISKKWGSKITNSVAKIVDGHRVMKLTKLRPGKTVGDIVRSVTEYVINNNVKGDKEIDKLIMKFYKEL